MESAATDRRAARGFLLSAGAVGVAFALQVEWVESATRHFQLFCALAALLGLAAWLYSEPALPAQEPQPTLQQPRPIGWLVLLPLAVLAFGLALLFRDLRSHAGAWLWLAGVVGVVAVVTWREHEPARAAAPRAPRTAVFVALVLFALCLRLYQIETLPAELVDDEALIAEWGMAAVHGTPLWDGSAAEHTTIFRRGGAAEPMLGCAVHGAVMAVAGENVFGLRLTAALAGALGVGLLYLLLLEFLRPGAALGAAFLLAVCHTHLYWTRSGMLQALVAMVGTALMLALLRGLRSERMTPWLVAGALLGLEQHLYEGGRFLVPILAPFFLILAAVQRGFVRRHWHHVAAMAALSAAVFAPLGFWYLKEPQTFTSVSEGAFIFGQPEYLESRYPGLSVPEIIAAQLRRSLEGFVVRGDLGTFYTTWKPLFDPVVRALVLTAIAGFTLSLRIPFVLLSLWFWVPVLIACTVTVDPPPMSRLMLATPALFGIAGALLDRLSRLAERGFGSGGAQVAAACGVFAIAAAGLWNVDHFFVRFPELFPANALTAAAQMAAAAAPGEKVYFVGGDHLRAYSPTVRFLARGVARANIDASGIPVQERGPRGALFLLEGDRYEELDALRRAYPGGQAREHYDHNGGFLFHSYRVGEEELARAVTSDEAFWHDPALRFGWAGRGAGELHRPRAIAVTDEGRVYVADSGNRRVDVYSPTGEAGKPIDTRGEAAAGNRLDAMALAPDGTLVVLNRKHRRLTRIAPDTSVVTRLGADDLFDDPVAVAAAPDGSIVVVDAGRAQVVRLAASGEEIARSGSSGGAPGQFDHPAAVAVDERRRVFVLDLGNGRVQRFSPELAFEAAWPVESGGLDAGQLLAARGDAVYVLDAERRRVQRFTATGRKLWNVGGPGQPPHHLGWPVGVTVDAQGRVWILDEERGSVYRYDVEDSGT